MKEFGDFENLPVLDLCFLAHAREAARSNLEIRDADRVLIGHPERELPRSFREQRPGAVAVWGVDVLEAGEPRQEMPGVTGVLIVVEPRDGGHHDRARFAGKVAPGSVQEVADGARRIGCATLERRGRGSGSGGFTVVRGLEARREGGEAAVDPDLAAADRRLERRAGGGEGPGSRKRAEQPRAHEPSRRATKPR